MRRDTAALWLCLLPPEDVERMATQHFCSSPHPDFPQPESLFFRCDRCQRVHWERHAVRLDGVGGHLLVGHYRNRADELRYMQEASAPQPVIDELRENIVSYGAIEYLGHEPTSELTPAAFKARWRKDLDAGLVLYLQEVKEKGEDPYRYFQPRPQKPAHFKLLANAELMERGPALSA